MPSQLSAAAAHCVQGGRQGSLPASQLASQPRIYLSLPGRLPVGRSGGERLAWMPVGEPSSERRRQREGGSASDRKKTETMGRAVIDGISCMRWSETQKKSLAGRRTDGQRARRARLGAVR